MAYENLKRIISARNISTGKLAFMSKIYPQDLYAIMKGKKIMQPAYRKRIADSLNIDEEKLFGDDDFTNLDYLSTLGGFVQVESDESECTTVIRFDSKWLSKTYGGVE